MIDDNILLNCVRDMVAIRDFRQGRTAHMMLQRESMNDDTAWRVD